MKKTKKHITIAVFAILIAALAFGYAYLTTTLSINGTTDIDANNWDVYFDNVQVTDGSVSGAQEIEAPTITSDTEVEFHVNLKKPGDFYEFTIEARNDGTIDAMISSVSKKLNNAEVTTLPSYLNYTVTYEDDIEIEDNHLLAAESLETYKIRVEFKKNISASDLPSSAQSLTLSFGVEYVQADETAREIGQTLYLIPESSNIVIGGVFPSNQTTYEDYNEILNSEPVFSKVVLNNNIINKLYVGFLYKDNVYFIQGGGQTYNEEASTYNPDTPYYEKNKATLKNAFGESNCNEDTRDGITYYFCKDLIEKVSAQASNAGVVHATNTNGLTCEINPDMKIGCGVIG